MSKSRLCNEEPCSVRRGAGLDPLPPCFREVETNKGHSKVPAIFPAGSYNPFIASAAIRNDANRA
jgi:hypothetical protein